MHARTRDSTTTAVTQALLETITSNDKHNSVQRCIIEATNTHVSLVLSRPEAVPSARRRVRGISSFLFFSFFFASHPHDIQSNSQPVAGGEGKVQHLERLANKCYQSIQPAPVAVSQRGGGGRNHSLSTGDHHSYTGRAWPRCFLTALCLLFRLLRCSLPCGLVTIRRQIRLWETKQQQALGNTTLGDQIEASALLFGQRGDRVMHTIVYVMG